MCSSDVYVSTDVLTSGTLLWHTRLLLRCWRTCWTRRNIGVFCGGVKGYIYIYSVRTFSLRNIHIYIYLNLSLHVQVELKYLFVDRWAEYHSALGANFRVSFNTLFLSGCHWFLFHQWYLAEITEQFGLCRNLCQGHLYYLCIAGTCFSTCCNPSGTYYFVSKTMRWFCHRLSANSDSCHCVPVAALHEGWIGRTPKQFWILHWR